MGVCDRDDLELLRRGGIELLGLLPFSSNYVFLARVCGAGRELVVVYKPRRGERPLWDFPTGTLAAREVAAYRVSAAAGWGLVPPTVLRADAPEGPGSLQVFVDHDPDRHYFELQAERPDGFTALAAFDVVINNADRKAGHIVEDRSGRLWALDHGVTFNVEDKLRTVVWDYAGQPLPTGVVERLEATRAELERPDGLGQELARLLSPEEAAATLARTKALLDAGRFPTPDSRWRWPWPLV